LQKLFLLLGIGETAGSGFSKIRYAWREQHWQNPQIKENLVTETTTPLLTMASLVPQNVVDELHQRFGGKLDGLSSDAQMARAMAAQQGSVTHEQLHLVTSTHPRDLTFLLQALIR